MQITGIEVIRHNPGVAVGVVTGEKVELTYGDTLRVNVSFDYRGISQRVTLYGAIGVKYILEFDEMVKGEADLDLPDSPEFSPVTGSVDIPITADISPGTDYDIYCKLLEYPEAGLPEVDNVIDIVGIPPTYELIHETISHFAYIYDGEVEETTATFKTDPFTPSAWAGELFASKLEEEYRARGGNVLEVRVYVDVTPLLWTDYRIELIGTPLGEEVEAARGIGVAGIPIAIAVVIIALAIIAVIVVATLMWERFQRSFEHKPGLEEVKPAWGKEALILDIQDAEAYWERPVTPPETLEGMSEEELRAYLDEIAEEEVPEVSWLPLVVVGGIALLGVGGAVAASALAKPKGKP